MKRSRGVPADAARLFLELYYPIHYRAGIGVEDALRGGSLSRHQVAVLWLIHAEGEDGRRLERKRIERSLSDWFGISGAAVTKAVQGLTQPPLQLLRLAEHPDSAREKMVILTSRGEARMRAMIGRGTAYVQRIIDDMSPEEIRSGLEFFRRITAIVDGWEER